MSYGTGGGTVKRARIQTESLPDLALIDQRLQRRRDAAAARYQPARRPRVDGNDGSAAEQAAKVDPIADALTDRGDQSDGCCFLVDHADRGFVGDDRGDRFRRRVAGNGDHIEADRTDRGHRLELVDGHRAAFGGFDHPGIFRERDEGAGKAADIA